MSFRPYFSTSSARTSSRARTAAARDSLPPQKSPSKFIPPPVAACLHYRRSHPRISTKTLQIGDPARVHGPEKVKKIHFFDQTSFSPPFPHQAPSGTPGGIPGLGDRILTSRTHFRPSAYCTISAPHRPKRRSPAPRVVETESWDPCRPLPTPPGHTEDPGGPIRARG